MKQEIVDLFYEDKIVEDFSLPKGSFSSSSLIAKALLIATSFIKKPRKMMLIANSLHSASMIYEYLTSFLNEEDILTFFADETVQIEAYAESLEMSANRIYSLYC